MLVSKVKGMSVRWSGYSNADYYSPVEEHDRTSVVQLIHLKVRDLNQQSRKNRVNGIHE